MYECKVTKNIQLALQCWKRNYLPTIELSAFIAHLLPVGLTGVGPTAAFFLLFLASPPDEQDEDEDKYDSHNVLFVC